MGFVLEATEAVHQLRLNEFLFHLACRSWWYGWLGCRYSRRYLWRRHVVVVVGVVLHGDLLIIRNDLGLIFLVVGLQPVNVGHSFSTGSQLEGDVTVPFELLNLVWPYPPRCNFCIPVEVVGIREKYLLISVWSWYFRAVAVAS